MLSSQPRKYKKLSHESQVHFAEKALLKGVSFACKKYGVPKTTGYSILEMWDPSLGSVSFQLLKPDPKLGVPRKLTPEIKKFLETKVIENNTLSGLQLAEMVFERIQCKDFKINSECLSCFNQLDL